MAVRVDADAGESVGLPQQLIRNISLADYGAMFHGDEERIDEESLRPSADFWERVSRDFLA